MSYPRKLHVLIIEDEQDPIDTYQYLLAALRDKYPSVEPAVVRSYDDARNYINGPNIIHLAILDLNLPLETRQQPGEGINSGEQLLDLLAQRDDYPIPAILVVSGKLQLARLSDLQARLQTDFWYGALVNKGDAELATDLETGMRRVQQYCDVGIHIADGGEAWFPPLTPREDDLLRRCVLSQPTCLGVDLQWWSAETAPTFSQLSEPAGTTKVLMGSFLLDDGMGPSRPTFFKFEPSSNAPTTSKDAAILDQKLRHVQVKCMLPSRTRYLLVTQSVTNGRPVPLNDYLSRESGDITSTVNSLIDDIVAQLDQLGTSIDGQSPVQQLLWPWHNRNRIADALRRFEKASSVGFGTNPLELFDKLITSDRLIWAGRRPCIHGDLNATNIAVDVRQEEHPHAFIFDAAGIHADTDTRDLAMLEVTSVLFNPELERTLHAGCLDLLYGNGFVPDNIEGATQLASVQNTLQFIVALRRRVEQQGKVESYALMVFDVALMQLGGLTIQPSRNKIIDGALCHALARAVCRWLLRVAPELVPEPENSRPSEM